jgi:hypothetical protein
LLGRPSTERVKKGAGAGSRAAHRKAAPEAAAAVAAAHAHVPWVPCWLGTRGREVCLSGQARLYG